MSCTMTSFFPTAPASPHAFSMFGQSPRESHATYEDLCHVLRPSNGHNKKRTSAPKPTRVSPSLSSTSSTFSLLTPSQSPREAHATYHDLCEVLRPSNGQSYNKRSIGKSGLKKMFGGI